MGLGPVTFSPGIFACRAIDKLQFLVTHVSMDAKCFAQLVLIIVYLSLNVN
jgi:hypothetical protein